MTINQWLKSDYLPIPLIALMVLTRFHHFGDVLHLPDASLAVFFFAGFYRTGAGKNALFAFLLAMAGLIDYVAIANGTSDWCVSPAYVFLIPTYALMWLAGSYCSASKSLAVAAGLVTLAASAAFTVSNGSFYLLSGRFGDLSVAEYAVRVARYYPSYVGSALVYALAGLIIVRVISLLPAMQARHYEV